jgi:hypothetical protein
MLQSEVVQRSAPESLDNLPSRELMDLWIEALRHEFIDSALLSCRTAIAVRSPGNEQSRHRSISPNAILPPQPSSFPAIAGQLEARIEFVPLVDALREFYDAQTCARGLTTLFLHSGGGRAQGSAPSDLDEIWQNVVSNAGRALYELEKIAPWEYPTLPAVQLGNILEQTAAGAPVTTTGFGPSSTEREHEHRSVMRTKVNAHVRVERGLSLLRLLVTNVSHRGLGANGLERVIVGEHLRILWKPGVCIPVTVTWVNGRDFGLAITEPSSNWSNFVLNLLEITIASNDR